MDSNISQEHTTLLAKLEEQNKKLDAIFWSTERTRKYILAAVILMIVSFVLPFIGLIFAIPFFLSALNSSLGI